MNLLQIVYENEEILVINKPCGLAVQGGKGISSSVDALLSEQCGYKVYLVHRLDKETAGLLIIAKNSQAAHKWTNLIASKKIVKKYQALCFGAFFNQSGSFDVPVKNKKIVKSAKTEYRVLKTGILSGVDQPVSLVSLRLETGRMHQIRIHLAQNKTPIIGDDKYGDFKLNKLIKKSNGVKKLHLAAIHLEIPGKTIEIPIPAHMVKTVELLD
ncbi:MAG: hypothetical protein BKP49_02830 [Treponema sp. CETP13]|nr:MAG: hypothetical protein BKP49_02830 [Treponema sp. CETP13]